jgi:fido (protein-threonine AMPylation protein)
LLHSTSIFDLRLKLPDEQNIEEKQGLRLMKLPAALIHCSPRHFVEHPTKMRAALSMISDASDVLHQLLTGGHSKVAGRLAGAFRNIGREQIASDILKTMRAAGYKVSEQDPFAHSSTIIFNPQETSPYVNRLRLSWQNMRAAIIDHFPPAPGLPANATNYLKQVEGIYVTDAYHSLSIEGYRVSIELIERVKSGNWHPATNSKDRQQQDVLAARGYWQAFQSVKNSIARVLNNENPGEVIAQDHKDWYQKLFTPSVTSGIIQPTDLAGYRNNPVYIRRSMHVPPNYEAVRELMPAFMELLQNETEPAVRVVLGHFIFVYIHPYVDGNGRMGRFLMNVMLAAGGYRYSWTIVPVEKRDTYMAALEAASVEQDILPFTQFLAGLVEH